MSLINNKFLENKKILITGHTGFKGSWLCHILLLNNAKIYGISKDIPTKPSIFRDSNLKNKIKSFKLDIKNRKKFIILFNKIKPDLIFHLAAQPLVITSYKDPVNTINSNIIGTINILEALRQYKKKCTCIMITSDKAYENVEQINGYKEEDKLGGKDIYSATKASADILIQSYFNSFFKKNTNLRLGVARAGNVIGGGDWASDRVVVDAIKSWTKGIKVTLRNPKSTRPWQHVLEPLDGYITFAKNLSMSKKLNGHAFNFGPSSQKDVTVEKLINDLGQFFQINKPTKIFKNSKSLFESNLLKLNCNKAKRYLKWKSKLSYKDLIYMTGNWYKDYVQNKSNVTELINRDIIYYEKKKYKK